jgi:hypothetical protein
VELGRLEALELLASQRPRASFWKMQSCRGCFVVTSLLVVISLASVIAAPHISAPELDEIKSSEPPCHLYSNNIESPCFITVKTVSPCRTEHQRPLSANFNLCLAGQGPEFAVRQYKEDLWWSTVTVKAGWSQVVIPALRMVGVAG